jgi:hypothetical protein
MPRFYKADTVKCVEVHCVQECLGDPSVMGKFNDAHNNIYKENEK